MELAIIAFFATGRTDIFDFLDEAHFIRHISWINPIRVNQNQIHFLVFLSLFKFIQSFLFQLQLITGSTIKELWLQQLNGFKFPVEDWEADWFGVWVEVCWVSYVVIYEKASRITRTLNLLNNLLLFNIKNKQVSILKSSKQIFVLEICF